MKKSLMIMLMGVLGIVVAGCGKTAPVTDENTEDVIVSETTETDDAVSEEKFEATMKEMFEKGGEMTCTMKSTEDGVEMNGTLYMDGKKMRSEMKAQVGGMDVSMNTVIKDGYSYMRTNSAKEGWKSKYSEEEEVEEGLNDAATDTDVNTRMSFDCKKGVENDDAFELPSSVEFKELNF